MKSLLIIVFSFLFLNPVWSQNNTTKETTTYYLIRHAEKDRSNPEDKDPYLTNIGHARADRWSSILKHVNFDAIYSTDYNRTRETAQPIVTKNGLKLSLYHPKNIDLSSFLKRTRGKTVLIVGHSNTTPFLVNDIIRQNKYSQIEDNNNGNLYIISIINEHITDQLLYIE